MIRRLLFATLAAVVGALGPASAAGTDPSLVLAKQVAQAKPIGEPEKPLRAPGLPTGLSYTLDLSVARTFNNTGVKSGLPGGFDAVVGYGINPHLRVTAGVYTFQQYPTGFSQGTVPVYLQGFGPPIATQDLSQAGIDATTVDRVYIFGLQNLFLIAHKLPIIVTPTYIARERTVGGHSDLTFAEINGFPQFVHTGTLQEYLAAFTLPFLSTPRMFGTFTVAPQWLVHPGGANVENHAQLFQLLYLEYRLNPQTTFFWQPSILQDYTQKDQYDQHIPTTLYGVTYKLRKPFFLQLQIGSGTPTNPEGNQIGITSLTCQQLPCPPNPAAAHIAGLKATSAQLMIGIGTPSVIPL